MKLRSGEGAFKSQNICVVEVPSLVDHRAPEAKWMVDNEFGKS